jgi:hypothetical protein
MKNSERRHPIASYHNKKLTFDSVFRLALTRNGRLSLFTIPHSLFFLGIAVDETQGGDGVGTGFEHGEIHSQQFDRREVQL